MEMNPAMMDGDIKNPTNTQEWDDNKDPAFVPPVKVNNDAFIALAKKIPDLSKETMTMIEKDLQPTGTKEDTETVVEIDIEKKSVDTPTESEMQMMSGETKDPKAALIMGLAKVLWFPIPKK